MANTDASAWEMLKFRRTALDNKNARTLFLYRIVLRRPEQARQFLFTAVCAYMYMYVCMYVCMYVGR